MVSAALSAASMAKRSLAASAGPAAKPASAQCPDEAGNSHALHIQRQPSQGLAKSSRNPPTKKTRVRWCGRCHS
jgi:hypothetical protein